MIAAPGTLPWLARHELRLGWRDAMAAATGGKKSRAVGWLIGGALVYALMFLVSWFAVRPAVLEGIIIDKPVLVTVTGTIFLFWTVTLSQALESVTRVYYTRSDLDLILSSPASPARLFAVRSATVFLGTFILSGLLISPLVISLSIQDGPQWLSAYLVLVCFAAMSVSIAIGTTRLLFRIAGPRRTRLLAQIVAGIVGAGFVIGIQAAAILSEGGFSRLALFQSPELIAAAPDASSVVWMPARAAMGNVGEGIALAVLGLTILLATITLVAPSYASLASAAAGLNHIRSTRRASAHAFAPRSQRQTLRRKEWKLLQRDPWLLSQTLMQLLYMLPPALLLWVNYGASGSTYIVAVPVLVMAAGQLAGGLAWLAISGEDAADLVTTAPISPATLLQAKVEAVLFIIVALLTPMIIALLFVAPAMALAVAVCGGLAAATSTAIQLWFRVAGKRSQFRRRHTASRIATITEAFSSILWAGTGALWAGGSPFALGAAGLALFVLLLARVLAPRKA